MLRSSFVFSVALVVFLVGWVFMEWVQGDQYEVPQHRIRPVGEVGYEVHLPPPPRLGWLTAPYSVWEDGRPLGPAVDSSDEATRLEEGRYHQRHFVDSEEGIRLVFTASDGSDPRENRRSYSFRRAPKAGTGSFIVLVLAWLSGSWLLSRREPTEALLAEIGRLRLRTAAALLAVLVYSLYVFQSAALTVRIGGGWLVLVLLLAVFAYKPKPSSWWSDPRWPWLLGFILWAGVTVLVGTDFSSASSLLGTIVAVVLGSCLVVFLSGSFAATAQLPVRLVLTLAGGFAILVLLRHFGYDWGAWLESYGRLRIRNGWVVKFSEHWAVVLAWMGALALARSHLSSTGSRSRQAIPALALFLLVLSAVLPGRSHSAVFILVFSVSVAFFGWTQPRATRIALVWSVVLIFLLAPLLAPLPWNLRAAANLSETTESWVATELAQRGGPWATASELLQTRWLTGLGFGATAHHSFQQVTTPDLHRVASTSRHWFQRLRNDGSRPYFGAFPGGHPHSLPLLIWVDLGLPGVLLSCGLLWAVGQGLRRYEVTPEVHASLLGLFAATLGAFGVSYPAWNPIMVGALMMTVAIATMFLEPNRATTASRRTASVLVGLVLLTGSAGLLGPKLVRWAQVNTYSSGDVRLLDRQLEVDGGLRPLVADSRFHAVARWASDGPGESVRLEGWAYHEDPQRQPDYVLVFYGDLLAGLGWPEGPSPALVRSLGPGHVRAFTKGFRVPWSGPIDNEMQITLVGVWGDRLIVPGARTSSALSLLDGCYPERLVGGVDNSRRVPTHDTFAAEFCEVDSLPPRLNQDPDSRSEGFGIAWRHDDPSSADDFPGSADIGSHDWSPAGHRLSDHIRKALPVDRGGNNKVETSHHLRGVLEQTEGMYPRLKSMLSNQLLELGRVFRANPDNDQMDMVGELQECPEKFRVSLHLMEAGHPPDQEVFL